MTVSCPAATPAGEVVIDLHPYLHKHGMEYLIPDRSILHLDDIERSDDPEVVTRVPPLWFQN